MTGERYGISLIKVEPWNDCKLLSEEKNITPTTAKGLCMHSLSSDPKGKNDPRKKSSSLPSQRLSVAIRWHEKGKPTALHLCQQKGEMPCAITDITTQYFTMYDLALTYFVCLKWGESEGKEHWKGFSSCYAAKCWHICCISFDQNLRKSKFIQVWILLKGSKAVWKLQAVMDCGEITQSSLLKQRLHRSLQLHTLIQWKTASRTHLCLSWFRPQRCPVISDSYILFLCKGQSFYLQCTWATNKF